MPPDTPNGRVTMALLGQRLDQIITIVQHMSDKLDTYIECNDSRVRLIELQQATNVEQLKTMTANIDEQAKDIKGINTRYGIWGAVNSLATVVSNAMGIFIIGGKP